MNKFQDIIEGKIDPSIQERLELVAAWLKDEYNLNNIAPEILHELLAVHTHSQSRHFGHPLITSSFGNALYQIVFATGRWHLSFRKEPQEQWTLLHPKSEYESWNHPMNRKFVGEASVIIKSGKIQGPVTPVITDKPTAFIDGDNVSLHIPDKLVDEASNSGLSTVYDSLSEIDENGRKSITIDLGSLLK